MFIYVLYKDEPELSSRRSSIETVDTSVEKSLLVNPDCPVRIMLEYIRKKCRLGIFTQFDLCDESGVLKGLFNLNTYAYATEQFEHKKVYYVIVLKMETDKTITVFPQLNQENKLYSELQDKVKRHLTATETSASFLPGKKSLTSPIDQLRTSPGKASPGKASPGKASPAKASPAKLGSSGGTKTSKKK